MGGRGVKGREQWWESEGVRGGKRKRGVSERGRGRSVGGRVC